ncbi:MAG: DUF3098 domain-containing protein [Bacteroidales bacterium]|nr:DUF3098 domain-containing protein [Bacteroidales bacterium]
MKQFAFQKINFIILAVSIATILLGFILMSGEGSSHEQFNEAIFDARHTLVAPMVCLAGYVGIVVAILYRGKRSEEEGSAS